MMTNDVMTSVGQYKRLTSLQSTALGVARCTSLSFAFPEHLRIRETGTVRTCGTVGSCNRGVLAAACVRTPTSVQSRDFD
eukprot:3326222-Rhodomonas_salina.5